MNLSAVLVISIAAAAGAVLRWIFGIGLNSLFPTLPLGTLAANLLGGFLMGIFIGFTRNNTFISELGRLAITTGFLGGLTTFSTFSAETVNLLSHQEYFWASAIIIGHVAGSLVATIFGIYTIKMVTA